MVVDVGCGTGAAARFAAQKIDESGMVVGTDVNPGMLRVAAALPPVDGAPITWQQETAYALSADDEASDAVLCAQTLQFLDKRHDALREMRRILKTGESLYVSLWCPIAQNPYFDALVHSIAHHIGEETAAGLKAAFQLSNLDEIHDLLREASFVEVEAVATEIPLTLPPISDFVPRHIAATPMGPGYAAAPTTTQQAVLDTVAEQLADYQSNPGIRVPFRSHLIRAVK
jgi:SAM-dependent methyltransferase